MADFEFNALSPTEIEIVEQPRLRPGRHKEYQREFREERGCYFINQTVDKSTIPAYAVIQPKDNDGAGCILDVGGRPLIRAIKRNDEPCDVFYVNGPRAVEYGKGGRCVTLAADIPTRVMLDPDLDPAMHDCLGPVEDQWYLGPTGLGFLWLAAHPDEDDTAWVQRGLPPGAVIFKNNDATTAPKFGVGRITGETEVAGNTVTTIVKPDTTFGRRHIIVGPRDVAAGKYGIGYAMDGSKRRVLYDSGTPAAGQQWGPKPSQWSLSSGYPGFLIDGNVNTEDTTVYATGKIIDFIVTKTTGTHNKSALGNCNIYIGTGARTLTTFTAVSVYNRFANLASGKFLDAKWDNEWEGIAGEC